MPVPHEQTAYEQDGSTPRSVPWARRTTRGQARSASVGAGGNANDGVGGAPPPARDGNDNDNDNSNGAVSVRRLLMAFELLHRPDRAMLLLAPFQVAFGFMSALLVDGLNGQIVKESLGAGAIAYLTAVLAGTATVASSSGGACLCPASHCLKVGRKGSSPPSSKPSSAWPAST